MQGRTFAILLAVPLYSACASLDCSQGPYTVEIPFRDCVSGYCVSGTKMVTFCANWEPQSPEQLVLASKRS